MYFYIYDFEIIKFNSHSSLHKEVLSNNMQFYYHFVI